jgi:hypothetical protein
MMGGQQDWDWREARRLAGYVRAAGRTGLHRTDADRLMGGTVRDRSTAFGLAYSKRWIDVCGQWIVQPPHSRSQNKNPARNVPGQEPVVPEPDPVLFRPHGAKWRRA